MINRYTTMLPPLFIIENDIYNEYEVRNIQLQVAEKVLHSGIVITDTQGNTAEILPDGRLSHELFGMDTADKLAFRLFAIHQKNQLEEDAKNHPKSVKEIEAEWNKPVEDRKVYQFHIHHCTGKDSFQEVEVQPRRYAGFVMAQSLEDAFKLSQNLNDNTWNQQNPCRSTSVGDIIQHDGNFFMVCGMGFKELISENDKPEEKEPELEYPQ